ncbi:MAG: 16S rRNA (cytosine(1402)-N(4))-methyltransferase RsmH [Bryobacterales bacterium]|nr:16S rRNA (cytosine(1402)-N(4))-methyltransferase RsmH [Bryobacterales bacterium]
MEHFPVMLNESLEWLDVRPEGVYLDATAGLGNHSRAIAARLAAGRLVMHDRDGESLDQARRFTSDYAERILPVRGRFSELRETLDGLGLAKVDGLLADLGVSRPQLTSSARGFSFMNDGPLDMRMSREENIETAADLVNFSSEQELARIIAELGEERGYARKITRALIRARPILTTGQLARAVEALAGPRRGHLNPSTKVFMGLRLAVNSELEEVEALMRLLPDLVASGGRVVVISFHSLEDRLVKQGFLAHARGGRARILTKHVVRPAEEEVRTNAASRSAKLRAIEIV